MTRLWMRFALIACATTAFDLYAQAPGDAIALQGIRGNTLVAGKSTAFRLFTTAATFSAANRVDVVIVRPNGSQFSQSWLKPNFASIATSRAGSSIVVLVKGADLPWVGGYRVAATITGAGGAQLASYSVDPMQLLPTKDVIVAIDRVNANDTNPGTTAEIQAARDAMARLAAIWPIRDGVDSLDGDRSAGLRFSIDNHPQGYGCNGNPKVSDCQLCPFLAKWENRAGAVDNINLGVGYRFTDRGEQFGGIAPNFCPNQSIGWASVVMSGPLAPGIGQEAGHVFQLEPTNDPHFDPSVQAMHSKDDLIDPAAVDLGFDVQLNRPFPSSVHDVMHQAVCGCPNDETSYNAWDWEFLRAHFATTFTSTGPSAPSHFLTQLSPGVAGAGHAAYFFATRTDERVYFNRAVLGQGGSGWSEVDGNGRTNAAPSAAAIGTHLYVAIKGLDGQILLNQADDGKSFGQWFPLNFQSDLAPAVATVSNRVFVFGVSRDHRVFATQAVLGSAFSPWVELQGQGQSITAPSAASVGTHLFVGITGIGGLVQLNQAELGHAWSGWQSLKFNSIVAPALTSVGNSIFVFARAASGSIQLDQAPLGKAFSGWFEVQGGGRTASAPAAASIGNHIFVVIRDPSDNVSTNQTDFGKAFGSWVQ